MWPLLVLALATATLTSADCPRNCECKWRSGKESVLCTRAGLTALPPLIPPTTTLLDLTNNRLSTIRNDAFKAAGLVHLQRLYLTQNNVHIIRQYAFRALENLVELDLSRNRLESVPSHSFAEVPLLRDLRLTENPISKIKDEAFVELTNLVRLSLTSCKIVEIEPRAFVGVEASLEYLDITNNRLRVLHVAVLAPLRSLKGLELAKNPWECTCALRPMRDWMIRRNVPATIVPECALPPRLVSQSWDRLDLEDFACMPEISAESKHTIGSEGSEVTLVCRVIGVPAMRVRWMRGGRLVANSSATPHINGGRLYVLRGEGQMSNLTVKVVDLQDAGSYTCTAENRAGKADAMVTLTVQRKPSDKGLGGRALLAGVAVSAVIVLSLCLIALCAYETRKKRQLDRWNEQTGTAGRRDESYEKIEMNLSKNSVEDARLGMVQCDSGRKRGDYRNVPSCDPEDETEGYVARVVRQERVSPPVSARGPSWLRAQRSPPGAGAWTSRCQETDLHIPRLTGYTSNIRIDSTPESVPSSTSTGVMGGHIDHFTNENGLNNNPQTRLNTRKPRDRLDNDLSGSDSEKNYPDLLEMSTLGMSSYTRNYDKKQDPYFYTIPRRKDADSRSPLLGSRRNSSGGDSCTSFEKGYDQIRSKPSGRRSNSFLDLATGNTRSRRNPSLPASPNRERPTVPSATPLLDLSGLRGYSRVDQPLEDYDFRASQLEKFLEEYRNLRDQLSKMKETRESLQRNRAAENDEMRSIIKGKTSVAVTETSSLVALADAASPLTLSAGQNSRPEWISTLMYRN